FRFAARALLARAAGRRVRGDDAPAGRDVEAAELVAEGGRRLREQQRMAPAERLQIGAVRERDLDLHEHVALAGHWIRHLLDAEISGRVEARRPHGTKTTFNTARRRKSS